MAAGGIAAMVPTAVLALAHQRQTTHKQRHPQAFVPGAIARVEPMRDLQETVSWLEAEAAKRGWVRE